MLVRSVSLRDFRNYERAEASIGPALTVVSGPNGAGKTNLLEGIYFGLTGRSCRTRNEREVVRQGSPVARATVVAADADGEHRFEVGFEPGERKRSLVDGAPADGSATAARRPLVSVFVPERLELVKGAPSARRGHVDQFTAALWPARAAARADYGRALAQRNAMIARIRAGGAPALLDPWDAALAKAGIELMQHRASVVEAVAERFAARARELGLPADCALRYRPRSPAADAEELRAELEQRREDEIARGFSGHGPHRDEFVLTHGGRPLRAYGSQGQQRSAVLALLLAERDALAAAGRAPLLLLDDVMSELDTARRERLAAAIAAGGQAVVTATEADQVPAGAFDGSESIRVEAGSLAAEPRLAAA